MGDIGPIISFLFFGMVVIAALTSVISLMEVVAQFVIQKFKISRKKATLTVCIIGFLISIPIAWSVGGAFDGAIHLFGFDLLTFFDETTNTVLMPVSAFMGCLAIGWFIDGKKPFKEKINPMSTLKSLEDEGLQLGKFGKLWIVMVKYITPLLILLVEFLGVDGKIKQFGSNYWFIVGFALIIIAISVAVYFIFFKNAYTGENKDELEA